jgi:hypothetical protein
MQNKTIYKLLIIICILLSPVHAASINKVSVAILPLKLNTPEGLEYLKGAYMDMLSSRIGSDGEIHVIEEARVRDAVGGLEGFEATEEAMLSLARKIGASYIINASLSLVGENLSLDVKVFEASKVSSSELIYKGRGLEALMDIIDKLALTTKEMLLGGKTPRVGVSKAYTGRFKSDPVEPESIEHKEDRIKEDIIIRSERKEERGPWKSLRFLRAFKAIEVADLDNDDKNEIIVIDEKDLLIYILEDGRLVLKKEIKGTALFNNYGIAVGDINGNGRTEIYISRMYGDRPSSSVIEFIDGDYEVIVKGLPWFMRLLKRPGGEDILIGQRFRATDGFYGGVRLLKWEGGAIEEDGLFNTPRNVGLYGFALLDLNDDGAEDLISLDNRDRLRIYEKGDGKGWKQVWKSPGFYGGSLNNLEYTPSEALYDTPEKINIKGKILYRIIGGEDGLEIVINSNEPGGLGRVLKNIMSYESGEIFGLSWDGVGLNEKWRTKKISGYIADFLVGDLDGDEEDELVILVVDKLPGIMSGGESFIMSVGLN